MSLSERMTALRARLAAYPGTRAVWLPMPDEEPDEGMLPAFGISLLPIQIKPSNVTVFTYPMAIEWFYEGYPEDLEYDLPDVVMDAPQAIFNWLAADETVVEGGYGIQFGEPGGSIGMVSWWDKTYAGCQLFIAFKEKENTVWGV